MQQGGNHGLLEKAGMLRGNRRPLVFSPVFGEVTLNGRSPGTSPSGPSPFAIAEKVPERIRCAQPVHQYIL